MKLAVKKFEGGDAGEITLPETIFGIAVRTDIMHIVVNYQLAKRRSGNHKTKQRHEVSGTGKKPHAQKGTGRARAGDKKRNIDRGGAVVHGPVVRDHSFAVPKKIRQLALRSALSAKAAEGKLIILDDAKLASHKTKPAAEAIKALGLESAVIVTGEEVDANFARATANLPRIDVLPTKGANVYDILRRDTLVLTKEAVEGLTDKLSA